MFQEDFGGQCASKGCKGREARSARRPAKTERALPGSAHRISAFNLTIFLYLTQSSTTLYWVPLSQVHLGERSCRENHGSYNLGALLFAQEQLDKGECKRKRGACIWISERLYLNKSNVVYERTWTTAAVGVSIAVSDLRLAAMACSGLTL